MKYDFTFYNPTRIHFGKNALDAALALYADMQRTAASLGGDFLLSVGKWNAGDAPNVLPAHAKMAGSFRSVDERKQDDFQVALDALCARCALPARVRYLGACPPLKNDATCISLVARACEACGIPIIEGLASKGNAAEDFAVFASACPGVAIALAAGRSGRGYDHPLHHPKALFDEDALAVGAAAYAVGALALGKALALQTFTKGTGA